jgi:hypothetical protein
MKENIFKTIRAILSIAWLLGSCAGELKGMLSYILFVCIALLILVISHILLEVAWIIFSLIYP